MRQQEHPPGFNPGDWVWAGAASKARAGNGCLQLNMIWFWLVKDYLSDRAPCRP